MKQGFALPLAEEDLNWCTWIIGEVEHDGPNEVDLGKIARRISVDEDDEVQETIKSIIQGFQAAGLTVTFIRDAELEWLDL